MRGKREIVEKKLGIPPDYQYKAMRSRSWLQRNWHKNKFEVVRKLMGFEKGHEVLDLGTGSGNFELLFARKVKNIIGVDYNDEAIEFLQKQLERKKLNNVGLIWSDVRKLPKKVTTKKYDRIVIVDVIEHIPIGDAEILLGKLRKMLKKGGKLLVITPNYKSIWTLMEKLLDRLMIVPKFNEEQHLAKFNSENMRNILAKQGYKKIQNRSFNLFSYVFPGIVNDWLLNFESKRLGVMGCLLTTTAVA